MSKVYESRKILLEIEHEKLTSFKSVQARYLDCNFHSINIWIWKNYRADKFVVRKQWKLVKNIFVNDRFECFQVSYNKWEFLSDNRIVRCLKTFWINSWTAILQCSGTFFPMYWGFIIKWCLQLPTVVFKFWNSHRLLPKHLKCVSFVAKLYNSNSIDKCYTYFGMMYSILRQH